MINSVTNSQKYDEMAKLLDEQFQGSAALEGENCSWILASMQAKTMYCNNISD